MRWSGASRPVSAVKTLSARLSAGLSDFRAALENGILLCDLINKLKPGIIKRLNRLSTPIAGLDNVNVFLKACEKLGLNDWQRFHPGDLQDISSRVMLRRDEGGRRLKNVLITIYWLGRKAQLDAFYVGPQLNFKAFEGLLGLALSKVLDEGSNVFVKDGEYKDDEYQQMRQNYFRNNSVDNIEPRRNTEGCGSDTEAEQVFKMSVEPSANYGKGCVPPPLLLRKRGQANGSCSSPLSSTNQIQARPERPVQVNPGWIWSKSLTDIPMVYPVRKTSEQNAVCEDQDADRSVEWNKENKNNSTHSKDSEAQWQDELTRWKNRRRSIKTDLRTNSQDREHVIRQMTNGSMTNYEKSEVQQIKGDQQSPGNINAAPCPDIASPPSKSHSNLQPHTRALLACSYATEASFSPPAPFSSTISGHTQVSSAKDMPASGNVLREEAPLGSSVAGVASLPVDSPVNSQIQVNVQGSCASSPSTGGSQPENVLVNKISTLFTTIHLTDTGRSSSSGDPPSPMSRNEKLPFSVDPNNEATCIRTASQSGADAQEKLLTENRMSQEESQKSSSQQVAGQQKCLSRTGTWSGSASLPRGYRRSEGSGRLSSSITARPFGIKQSKVLSLPRLWNVDSNRGLLLNCELDCSPSPTKSSLKRQTATTHLKGPYQSSVQQKKTSQSMQNAAQMEEGNGALTTSFETNGYTHQPSSKTRILPQPHSSPIQHVKTSALSSNASTDLPKVDHSDMRVSLALRPNSIPDFGFDTHWDSAGVRVKLIQPGSLAEVCQLRVDDEIVAVDGVRVAHMNSNQWKDKMASALQTGRLTMDIRRNGHRGHPDHHANGAAAAETAVTIMPKFNGQTDNALQGKDVDGELCDKPWAVRSTDNNIVVKNLKRRAEFFNQKGGSESAISDLQVPSLSSSSSSWSWDREEDRRRQEKWQEEQERLLQEQYQRDQERLEAEWRRAQQDVMDNRKSLVKTPQMTSSDESVSMAQHYVNGMTKKIGENERSPIREEPREAGAKLQSGNITETDWAKSLSSPVLDGPDKQSGGERKRIGQSLSKAEQERQQILEEMKKRTQLLTDNSWIRQRSSSFYREPSNTGTPLKRYESLDDLGTLNQPFSSSAAFPRPHSAAAAYVTPSRNAYSRYSTGAIMPQRAQPMEPYHHGSTWAAINISEEQRVESRFESETGSPTANSAASNSRMAALLQNNPWRLSLSFAKLALENIP
ncbi:LIM domain only protein 7-like isoform 3-T4 [Pholidichthys leucotaenia]